MIWGYNDRRYEDRGYENREVGYEDMIGDMRMR
jgi:hypothetical protein